MWSPATKATFSTWANMTKPSPQEWCLAATMKAPAGSRSCPFRSTLMPATQRIAQSMRLQ